MKEETIDNNTLVEIIMKYQKDDRVHQFTCGYCIDSDLEPRVQGGVVILACPKCDWIQDVSERVKKAMCGYMAVMG